MRFIFGIDAMSNLYEIAENLPQNAWKTLQLNGQQFALFVDDQMKLETEKPAHRGFASFRQAVKYVVSSDSLVAANRQGRRVDERNAGACAEPGLQIAADATKPRWWACCKPCQLPVVNRQANEWWANMEEVFHAD